MRLVFVGGCSLCLSRPPACLLQYDRERPQFCWCQAKHQLTNIELYKRYMHLMGEGWGGVFLGPLLFLVATRPVHVPHDLGLCIESVTMFHVDQGAARAVVKHHRRQGDARIGRRCCAEDRIGCITAVALGKDGYDSWMRAKISF